MSNRQRSRRSLKFALPGCGPHPARHSEADDDCRSSNRGGRATLRRDGSHEAPAPNESFLFANLVSHYVPQHDERSCSVASVAMLVNAIRAGRSPVKDADCITPRKLLSSVGRPDWISAVGPGGDGVGLEELAGLVLQSLSASGIKGGAVDCVHVRSVSRAARSKVRQALLQAARAPTHFLLANFLQSLYTGNPAAAVGHYAPVGGYDARRRIFILDPDSRWHEPYWVSEDAFLSGMATRDETTGKSRGYLSIRIEPMA
jgi:hypothetical protein